MKTRRGFLAALAALLAAPWVKPRAPTVAEWKATQASAEYVALAVGKPEVFRASFKLGEITRLAARRGTLAAQGFLRSP